MSPSDFCSEGKLLGSDLTVQIYLIDFSHWQVGRRLLLGSCVLAESSHTQMPWKIGRLWHHIDINLCL